MDTAVYARYYLIVTNLAFASELSAFALCAFCRISLGEAVPAGATPVTRFMTFVFEATAPIGDYWTFRLTMFELC